MHIIPYREALVSSVCDDMPPVSALGRTEVSGSSDPQLMPFFSNNLVPVRVFAGTQHCMYNVYAFCCCPDTVCSMEEAAFLHLSSLSFSLSYLTVSS